MIPVGEVLFELDKRIKAGKVPGMESIEELYVDGIHFNNVGTFIAGTTFYATMFKTDPRGIDARPYGPGKSEKDKPIAPPSWRRRCRTWCGRSHTRWRA